MALLSLLIVVAGGLAGCGGGGTAAPADPPPDPPQLFGRLVLNHPAANLSTVAPYDTLRLVATPLDVEGAPIAGLPAPTFRSSDTLRVRVSEDGTITALAAGTYVAVIASLSVGLIAHSDTTIVNVQDLASPPVLDTLSVHPLSPADTVLPLPSSPLLAALLAGAGIPLPSQPWARAVDAVGHAIPALQIAYQSLDTTVATVDRRTGELTLVRPGRVRLVARTYAYGVAKADTVALTVTWPAAVEIFVNPGGGGAPAFQNAAQSDITDLRLAPGGIVMWANYVADSVDVVFNDPTNVTMPPAALCTYLTNGLGSGHCGAGNVMIPADADPTSTTAIVATLRFRQFVTPGIYPYHTHTGASGRIVVTTDAQ